ncbi:hypothetical protein FV139_07050 [Parahaliea maris]|uniref:DUF1049 domain-containing protein n=1 Tax=Parahaliea maris TaxID=2716870 RepID=A0A5C9A6F8_9GAMM|nr:hypothetical protein [Parahaliea maris]TXS95629.1 hypothetical protein FV139_07050 [Parahaliea maris]
MAASRAAKRFRRTMVLGVLALATLVWAAIDQFGVPVDTVVELALGSALMVVIAIVGAGLFVALWIGLRRLLRRRD